MKKLLLLTKTLLAAALLCVGQNAWAAVEITETYDFKTFTQSSQPSITKTGDAITQTGESEKKGSVYLITSPTGLDLKNRFALDITENSYQIRFMWRTHATYAYQQGLSAGWNTKASTINTEIHLSVLDLKAGDKITFTYSTKNNTDEQKPRTCKNGFLTGVANDVALTSGTEYTVATDGNLDLYLSNNNFAINTVVIKTTGTETVSEPSFAITGAYNKTRKVTITAGTSDAGNDVTTYYTTDGSTPTTLSASFTTASQEITVGESAESESTVTVKAYSVSSASAESTVSSQNITVGTIIKLAQPSITLTNMGLDGGKYYKQYTFAGNSAGTYGTPVITVAGTLGGEAVANPCTASTAGTISVVASADGYADSDAATLDVDGAAFLLARAYDFTQDSYRDGLSVEGNNITITSAGVQVYRIYDVNHVEGLTLSNTNFGITKAQNSDTRKGLAPRWGAGNITINNWIDGSFATLTDLVGNGVYATSSNGSFSFGQINSNTFTALNIYTPADATVSATIGATGWATFSSDYALDFTGISEFEAYMITGHDGTVVTKSQVTGTVPAGTGLLLKGDAGNYTIPVVASSSTDVSANLMKAGTGEAISAEAGKTKYVLGVNGANAEFQKIVSETATVPTGKAYLQFNEEISARTMSFVGDITAVENVEAAAEAKANEGKFIENGKLVIVKNGQKFNAAGAQVK